MKIEKLLVFLFIGIVLIFSAGCTSSSNEGNSTELPTTISDQDQEFLSLAMESTNKISSILDAILDAIDNYDGDALGDALVVNGASIKVIADDYKTQIEALTVSPKFKQSKNYHLKALDEYSNMGFNIGASGVYIGKLDYDTSDAYMIKATKNINAASEYIHKAKVSLPT